LNTLDLSSKPLGNEFINPIRPIPVRNSILPSEPIQEKKALLIPHNFKAWEKFPDASAYYRPMRPVVEMSQGLAKLYKTGKGSESTKIERWKLEKQTPIAGSSHATIFLFRDRLTNRLTAGKHIAPDSELAKTEQQKLHSWGKFPHIVGFYGGFFRSIDQSRLLLMDLAMPTLKEILKSQNKLLFEDVVSIFQQLLETYQATSSVGAVHGDLKPSNLAYDRGKLTILDLGSAHSRKTCHYKANQFQTLAYRAPEVILGGPYNASVDLWSIGCIIYEIFVGLPFLDLERDGFDSRPWQREALYQIIGRIGYIFPFCVENCSLVEEFFYTSPSGSSLDMYEGYQRSNYMNPARRLLAVLQKESDERALPEKQARSFALLLDSIFQYQGRPSADKALQVCRSIFADITVCGEAKELATLKVQGGASSDQPPPKTMSADESKMSS
jgi:serine/threonine protein kinase